MEAARAMPVSDARFSINRAAEALAQAGGDRVKAARLLREWVEQDQKLKFAVLDSALDQAIWRLIRHVADLQRDSAWRGRVGIDDPSGLALVAASNLRSLYDYSLPLFEGARLGDATRRMLDRCFGYHQKLTRSHGSRAAFFDAVRERLPDDEKTTVREVWKEKELRALIARLRPND